jgi:predicted component of type VI protein secretion system
MAKLVLKFEQSVLKEVAISDRPVTIGRLPDNDIQIDNLAVSSHHARVFKDGSNVVVEDLNSLNGTFVNNQRVTKTILKTGDAILIGKHHIELQESAAGDQAAPAAPKAAAPKIEETVMLDSKRRKELLEAALAAQAAAGGGQTPAAAPSASPGGAPAAPAAAPRAKVPSLLVTKGSTDQKEYLLSGRLTVIGKSDMATVKIKGFFARLFAPDVAAQINKRDDGYYLARAGQIPKVNGAAITGPHKLNEGDTIEVGGLILNFVYRD